MNQKERFELITRNTEEILTKEDLKNFLEEGIPLKHYIGLEISGKIHLGTGLMCMQKVKDFMEAGVETTIFLADWHTWLNDKLGGDREVIKKVAVTYFRQGLIAAMKCVGGDPAKLNFLLGTDLYQSNEGYWATLIDVSKNVTLSRIKRSLPIMGRKIGEAIDFAKLIYPPMQVADIFFQRLTLAHAGIDQRKAHVIMRDVALKMKISPVKDEKGRIIKPVAVHHPLVLGLAKPPVWPVPKDKLQELWSSLKMSKSKPETCVFIHDRPDEIKEKIAKAFCPPKETEFNPIMNWAKLLVFNNPRAELLIKRDQRYGGNVNFKNYAELEEAYSSGKIHPQDLKGAVAERVIDILEPARKHFSQPEVKTMLEDLEKLM